MGKTRGWRIGRILLRPPLVMPLWPPAVLGSALTRSGHHRWPFGGGAKGAVKTALPMPLRAQQYSLSVTSRPTPLSPFWSARKVRA